MIEVCSACRIVTGGDPDIVGVVLTEKEYNERRDISHGICRSCSERLYGDELRRIERKRQ